MSSTTHAFLLSITSCHMPIEAANDNAPHDPRDYEDFDPSQLPADFYYEDDTVLDVTEFMSRYA